MRSEVVFSFDTTGSMSPCIGEVRNNVDKICSELFKEIPGLHIGLISHGDYCDGSNVINKLSLTDEADKVTNFVKTTPNTGGGDANECYEFVLQQARTLGWSKDANKVLVMIGDDGPHPVGYQFAGSTYNLDWKEELNALKTMGVRVYSLMCLYGNPFWAELAKLAETPPLRLTNFAAASEIIKGFVYASAGSEAFEKYENQLVASGISSEDVKRTNEILREEAARFDAVLTTGSKPKKSRSKKKVAV